MTIQRIFLTILLLISVFPLSLRARAEDTSSLTREEQKTLYEAQEALKKKEAHKAVNLLSAHLKNHPEKPNPLVYYALGNAYYKAGNPNKAIEIYEQGFRVHPSSFLLCSNLAVIAYQTKQYQKAGEYFEKAYLLEKPPKSERLYQAATAYYQAKAFSSAKSALNRLLSSKTGVQTSWLQMLIQICIETSDWKEAEKFLQDFLNRNPENTEYWKLLAHVRLRGNDYRGAAAALEILYELKSPARNDLEELANFYFLMNAPMKAARCLEKTYGRNPGPGECDRLFKAYAQAQRLDMALRCLDAAISQGRTSERLLEKGKLYYERGRWDEAIKALGECVRAYPDNDFAHLLLGYCALEKENFTLARQSFLKASQGTTYKHKALSALEALENLR